MKMLIYIKISGGEITINDRPESVKFAESQGWKLKEGQEAVLNTDSDVDPVQEDPPSNKVELPPGTGTTLYRRLVGEMIEGEEPPAEVLIESDIFPDEFVETKLQDGWFRDKEEAGNAPPDKP